MFAIGFVFLVFGYLTFAVFGSKRNRAVNMADKLGIPLFFVGIFLMVISITIKFWQWMP